MVVPSGIVATGFPRVEATCRQIGIEFDPWQTDLNRLMLAKGADGLYAADTVVMSIPRQVGKTFDVGAVVFALCIAMPGTTVVWTAHRFKVSRETFNELRGLAKTPKLAAHIDYDDITTAAGNECIPFLNGSRIVFAARERGAIRGFTKVRILILDEAQILTGAQLADLAPTMNQAADPLIILMGTPPKPSDPGEVFTELRADALAGTAEGVLYVELSAKPGSDPDDREAWRQANPSFPHRTPEKAILRLRKLLPLEDFFREALGIWDDLGSGAVIPGPAWAACEDPAAVVDSLPIFALDVSPGRDWAAIAVAGKTAAGVALVEVTSAGGVFDHRPGTAWVLPRLVELYERFPDVEITIAAGSAAETFRPQIEGAGIPVNVLPSGEVAAACGLFYDKATTAQLRHLGQPELTAALLGARKQVEDGETAWKWGRKRSTGDITCLYAATLALWVHDQAVLEPSFHFL